MENAKSEQIPLPINYYWNPTDPDLPFSSAAPGNPSLFPPGNATRKPVPTEYPKGTFPCWDVEKQDWWLLPDYRQTRLWDKATAQEIFSSTISCPATAIDVQPPSVNAVWSDDENVWVIDTEKEEASIVAERLKKKVSELSLASSQIEQLEEIVDDLDDGEEKDFYAKLLKEWKQYRAKLNLFKHADLKAVFPTAPKQLGD